ncbi:flagellin [Neorhizobium sp. T786]|uniref:flagellin N-terminal helical domain-containing protein n=1 Tax=Pseudorhizobium xiangyangii TaxID=2883104 RepID=UPI001CFF89D6|nr:flagellin [Neorhizobium xiangyangii]MCB5202655.1 flagellin [Neorhizobium xiangyangii]
MSSILTNVSAMSALQTLRSINNDMGTTQDRISSGLRVGSAADNAAYWSIATTMRSDNAAISAVQDALGMGAAKVDVAYAGMESAIEIVKEIKAKVVAATEQGVDQTKVQTEIQQLKEQLVSVANGASFNGENWLVGGTATESVISGFVRTGATVEVKSTTYDAATNALFADAAGTGGLLGTLNGAAFTVDGADTAALAARLNEVETALQGMTTAASTLGSLSKRIELQEDFAVKLTDALDRGIGRLVDADMNEESTRLKALQTQQQLGIQALSIANSSSQNILSLFR